MKQIRPLLILSILAFSAIFASSPAQAAMSGDSILLGVSFLKFDQETEGPDLGTAETMNTYYDVKLGYTSSWLYLGGIYSVGSNETNSVETNRTALGATVGYHSEGFLLDLSYFFQAEREVGTTVLGKGAGYALDFGYNYMMGTNFYLGLQMSYKSFTFKEKEAAGVTTTPENKIVSELYPMLNIGFMF